MKLLRKLVPLLLLAAMCLTFVACGEKANIYPDLRAHVLEKVGVGKGLTMTNTNSKIQAFLWLKAAKEGDSFTEGNEPLYLSAIVYAADNRYTHRVNILLEDSPTMKWEWRYSDTQLGKAIYTASATLDVAAYTGTTFIVFENFVDDYTPETAPDTIQETIDPVTEAVTEANAESITEAVTTAGTEAETVDFKTSAAYMATDLTNSALAALDAYCRLYLDADIDNVGFTSFSKDFRVNLDKKSAAIDDLRPATLLNPAYVTLSTESGVSLPAETGGETTAESTIETETLVETEDLGGFMSPARISYALRMTLLGIGMVFSVLALLWLVLVIFRKLAGGKDRAAPKAAKASRNSKPAEDAPAPTQASAITTAPAASIPTTDDPAVIAAITAAIAAMIESDPYLSAQFIGGFRVVSFRKKTGRTSWNHESFNN